MSMEAGLPAERLTRSTPAPRPGIVHLGLGAFFRAFGLPQIEEAMAASGGDWGVIGVSLQSPRVRDALAPQGWAYTAAELTPAGTRPRVISALCDVLVAPESPERVLAAMADPAIRIVSLTVTEKGYCHDPATGRLNRSHPGILHDLANPLPVTAIGYLVRALDRRRVAGQAPFTVLCCDNLPENGRLLRGLVLEFAHLLSPCLEGWIRAQGRFPATMVDRIVPATTGEDIARLAALTGVQDDAPVMHEPFAQWVIEEDFVENRRPDFAAAGAQMVADVTPYEHMKLRMLNGTHSALAYLGYLAGHETIAETVADPVLAGFVTRMWRSEIIPALDPPPGVDLAAQAAALMARYRNPAIRHRTWQIAMDGSQKLPQRLLGTAQAGIAAGRPIPCVAHAVAGWMRYVGGVDETGAPIDVRDPLAGDLRALSDSAPDPAGKVAALLSERRVFPADLAQALCAPVTAAYLAIVAKGARGALEDLDRA